MHGQLIMFVLLGALGKEQQQSVVYTTTSSSSFSYSYRIYCKRQHIQKAKQIICFNSLLVGFAFAVFFKCVLQFCHQKTTNGCCPFTLLPLLHLIKPYYKTKEFPQKPFNSTEHFIPNQHVNLWIIRERAKIICELLIKIEYQFD